jgi:hypothetical protein
MQVNAMQLPMLALAGSVAISLACPAAALAQAPEPAPPSEPSNQQPPAEVAVFKPVTFSQNQKIMFAAMSAGMPGLGQIFEKRYMPGYFHLGGAVALGAVTLGGWYFNVQVLQWTGAVGLTGLSAYSAWDAFFALPPQAGVPQ